MRYHIGISSIALWLYLEGQEVPVRGWANANGDIMDVESKLIGEGCETNDHTKKIDLSKVREVKHRNGWDGFSDCYGELKIKISDQ